jgi:hypothetical protein
MPKRKKGSITDQEWTFCYEWIKYGDIIKAYDAAYPSSASRSRARKHYDAKQIAKRPAVKAECNKIRSELRSSDRLTLEQHMAHCAVIRDKAIEAGQYAAAARAEELRGKAAGFYIEKHVVVTETLSNLEAMNRLEMLVSGNEKLQKTLGSALPKGIGHQKAEMLNSSPAPDEASLTAPPAPIEAEVLEATERSDDPKVIHSSTVPSDSP